MRDLSVAEVAERLRVDSSRVRQLLRSGALAGRRVGRDWVVPVEALASPAGELVRPNGRPPAPRRVWGLLDLLDGGGAGWLAPVARAQVRARARGLAGRDAAAWTRALRGREDRTGVVGHRSAVSRLLAADGVWPAGPSMAGSIGADLVAVDPVPEVYVRADEWELLAGAGRLVPAEGAPDVWVRMPRGVWPFGPGGPGTAALAASLLDGEWRAARAGTEVLNRLALMLGRPEQ